MEGEKERIDERKDKGMKERKWRKIKERVGREGRVEREMRKMIRGRIKRSEKIL